MSKTLVDVARDAAELPAPEQLKLARILLDLTETEAEPFDEVQAAWDEEIGRRLADLRAGTTRGVPLEKVQQRIEASLKRAD